MIHTMRHVMVTSCHTKIAEYELGMTFMLFSNGRVWLTSKHKWNFWHSHLPNLLKLSKITQKSQNCLSLLLDTGYFFRSHSAVLFFSICHYISYFEASDKISHLPLCVWNYIIIDDFGNWYCFLCQNSTVLVMLLFSLWSACAGEIENFSSSYNFNKNFSNILATWSLSQFLLSFEIVNVSPTYIFCDGAFLHFNKGCLRREFEGRSF